MGDIIINLDKPRKLVFDLNAMSAYEEVTGKSAFEIGEEATASSIRALLWACFIHEDDTLTLSDVGKLIHAGNMQEISKKMNQVIKTSSETDEEKDESTKN